jgi:hypothetical protein
MFADAAEDDKTHNCRSAVAITITRDGGIYSGTAYDIDDNMDPFAMIGALEMIKREFLKLIAE